MICRRETKMGSFLQVVVWRERVAHLPLCCSFWWGWAVLASSREVQTTDVGGSYHYQYHHASFRLSKFALVSFGRVPKRLKPTPLDDPFHPYGRGVSERPSESRTRPGMTCSKQSLRVWAEPTDVERITISSRVHISNLGWLSLDILIGK